MSENAYYPEDAGQSPHTALLGSEFVSFDQATQTATMRFNVKREMTTWRGGVQGGLVAGYLDDVMGYAYVAATGGVMAPLNLDISMSLIRLIPEGATIIGTAYFQSKRTAMNTMIRKIENTSASSAPRRISPPNDAETVRTSIDSSRPYC